MGKEVKARRMTRSSSPRIKSLSSKLPNMLINPCCILVFAMLQLTDIHVGSW